MTTPLVPSFADITYRQDPRHPISWTLDGFGLTHYDSTGVRWITTKSEGWRGDGPVRGERPPRDGAPGTYAGISWPDEKIIRLIGQAVAPGPAMRAMAERRIGSLLPAGDRLYRLQRIGEDGIAEVMYVKRDDAIEPQPLTSAVRFTWTVQLAAPDPRKLAPSWSASVAQSSQAGSGGVVSTGVGAVSTGAGLAAGVAPRYPVAVVVGEGLKPNCLVAAITGPAGPDVSVIEADTGAMVTVRGLIGDGQTVFVNCSPADAYDVPGAAGPIPGYGALSGADSALSAVSAVSWPSLPAGVGRRYVLAGGLSASTKLTMYARAVY